MQVDDELWNYALQSHSADYQECTTLNPERVRGYLAAVAGFEGIARRLDAFERITIVTSHLTLIIFESKYGFMSPQPKLHISLRDVDEPVTKCVSLKILGHSKLDQSPWSLSVLSSVEDTPRNFEIMLRKLLGGDAFEFLKPGAANG